jgi:hypothetical protein
MTVSLYPAQTSLQYTRAGCGFAPLQEIVRAGSKAQPEGRLAYAKDASKTRLVSVLRHGAFTGKPESAA